ncbi:hypothetical protein EVAR_5583_1 [Eumeta japonica]|uniref:Uncharacterized protein n=1 Tax=Eumeta variegata TaxID=151549 RepID=A0A4C1U1B9_EUMVA|nr:hypothetical protein EVAR_5583_1 [Eumeta japonica]
MRVTIAHDPSPSPHFSPLDILFLSKRPATHWLCAATASLLLRRIGRWSGREIARSALSLARSAQAERDNESCFFVCAAGVHRLIRRYHVKNAWNIQGASPVRFSM